MQERQLKTLERNSGYKVASTKKAKSMQIELVNYLKNKIGSPQAALHLLDELDKVFKRLQENPYQFPKMRIPNTNSKYRMAKVSKMNYIVIYKICNEVVYIMGIFHGTENYMNRLGD